MTDLCRPCMMLRKHKQTHFPPSWLTPSFQCGVPHNDPRPSRHLEGSCKQRRVRVLNGRLECRLVGIGDHYCRQSSLRAQLLQTDRQKDRQREPLKVLSVSQKRPRMYLREDLVPFSQGSPFSLSTGIPLPISRKDHIPILGGGLFSL